MKIWEIELAEGKMYLSNNGRKWIVSKSKFIDIEERLDVTAYYMLKNLLEMDFEEIIDWSKVAEDTPVLVKHNYDWVRRRFSHFDKINNVARVFTDGMDSYTVFQLSENHRYDEYNLSEIKLYKEEK